MRHTPLLVSIALLATSLAAQGGTLRTYGTGNVGTNGRVPAIWASPTPRPGESAFTLLVDDARATSPVFTLLAANAATLSVSGLNINIDPATSVLLPPITTNASGSGSLALPIPNVLSFLGITLRAQMLVSDAPLPTLNLAATRGLALRFARPGLVIVPRTIGGTLDPQIAIELSTGTQMDFSGGQVDNGESAAFSKDGSHLFVVGALGRAVSIYDARSFPPTYVKKYLIQGQGNPYGLAITPDGTRGYVVCQGPTGTTPAIEMFDANPSSPFFGNAMLPVVNLGGIRDAMDIAFDATGDFAYVMGLGLFSGAGAVMKVDTRTASATFNQVLNAVTFPGEFCWSVAVSVDGAHVYAAIYPFTPLATRVAIISTATFTELDMDPIAPGTQHLGGEISVPVTSLGTQATVLLADPRGTWLWVGNYASLYRVDVRVGAPTFKAVSSTTAGIASGAFVDGLASLDAADLVYLGTHTSGVVNEYDAATLTMLRTWNVGNNVTRMASR